jgi:hypothetical protein
VLATLPGARVKASVSREHQRAVTSAAAVRAGGDDDRLALQAADAAALAHVEADTSRSRQLHDRGLLDTASWRAQEARLAIAARARRRRAGYAAFRRPAGRRGGRCR